MSSKDTTKKPRPRWSGAFGPVKGVEGDRRRGSGLWRDTEEGPPRTSVGQRKSVRALGWVSEGRRTGWSAEQAGARSLGVSGSLTQTRRLRARLEPESRGEHLCNPSSLFLLANWKAPPTQPLVPPIFPGTWPPNNPEAQQKGSHTSTSSGKKQHLLGSYYGPRNARSLLPILPHLLPNDLCP